MIFRKTLQWGIVLSCAAGAVAFSGCAEDSTGSTNAVLEVANVQGVSFDDPMPATSDTASGDSADAAAVAEPATPAEKESPAAPAPVATDLPTAKDVPADIAMIPSATPVPTPPPVAATPAPAPEKSAPVVAAAPGAFEAVSFKILSGFKYEEPIPNEGDRPEDVEKRRKNEQIPADVKALDGKKAIVEGWMVPMEVNEDSSVKSFVLVKTQPQCCFGDMQAMNEWVDVMMTPGTNAEFNVDTPVKVYGQLEVGEKTEDGFVLSIYRMKADRVEI